MELASVRTRLRILIMEKLRDPRAARRLAFTTLGAFAIIVGVSVLISGSVSELPPVFLVRDYWTRVSSAGADQFPEVVDVQGKSDFGVTAKGNWFNWRKRSTEWWNNPWVNPNDVNWVGRLKLHNSLKNGTLWFDEDLENAFLLKLETAQFPSNCTKNFWIAHRTHDSGLLSMAHIFTPVVMMGVLKGDGYTVIPISQPPGKALPTFDGCGERNNEHIGCYLNVTSCRIEDDPARSAIVANESRLGLQGASWDSLKLDETTEPGGMTILQGFMFRFDAPFHEDAWRIPKLELWKELCEAGSAGVYNRSQDAVKHLRDSQIDFVFHSMISAWMLRQTSSNVKKIANAIMAKYANVDTGRPLWVPPVLALHIRQTDKKWEDPYYQKHKKYRSVDDYVELMKRMEVENGFQWQSIFVISDSGHAIQDVAKAINNVSSGAAPDSLNEEHGKRFIMYDWSFDSSLIERLGGHTHIPPDLKFAAQEHFLATLYIISHIADYSIVQYSSNVGRFIGEVIGARHRLSSPDPIGPNAYSVDILWIHD